MCEFYPVKYYNAQQSKYGVSPYTHPKFLPSVQFLLHEIRYFLSLVNDAVPDGFPVFVFHPLFLAINGLFRRV